MIEHYEVYYLDHLIGNLYFDPIENKYSYIVKDKIIDELNIKLFSFLVRSTDGYIDEFPFFESRISNMKKFNLQELKYPTDSFKIIKLTNILKGE